VEEKKKKASQFLCVMRPRCNGGLKSLEQTSLWSDFRACDIEDTGTQDVTKWSCLVTGCQPVGTHVSDREAAVFLFHTVAYCELRNVVLYSCIFLFYVQAGSYDLCKLSLDLVLQLQ
jgi:hypothetical protein